jgi:sarcosine oxidase, subunit gamma
LIRKENVFVGKHALKPLTALGHDAPKVLTIGTYQIAECFDVALASLASRRGREKEVARIAKAAKLPLASPATLAAGRTFSSFWLSTEQWMIEAEFAVHEQIEAELKSLFGDAASITEQTDAWVRFDISAPDLPPLFERLCNVDLASAGFGFASRTVIEHIGCYLIKRSTNDITVYGPRSSAQSLLHVIETAAHSL